jgi:hypothetical protein
MSESTQLSWFTKFSQWFYSSDFEAINQHSYIRLAATFHNLANKNGPAGQYLQTQLDLLKQNSDWNTVKSVELLLIPLLNEQDLDIELHYQLHKAQTLISEQEYEFFAHEYKDLGEDGSHLNKKRALLNKLTGSLHKHYEDRQLRSMFANKARLKIGIFFSLSIILSVLLLGIGIVHPAGVYDFCVQNCPGIAGKTLLPVETRQESNEIHLHYTIAALLAGFMGACFSMLISLKGRVESITLQELDNQHSLHVILTRIITGVGAALVCYYFFRAELLSGTLFPDLSDQAKIPVNSKTLFILIIWSFIAGFSEKLVPSILSKTEDQISKK